MVSWNEKFGNHTSLWRRSGNIGAVRTSSNARASSGHFSPTHTQQLLDDGARSYDYPSSPNHDNSDDEAANGISILELLCNATFLFLVFAISSLYFVVSGLQYWITPYLNSVIEVPQREVFIFYTTTCLSAPMLGVGLSIIIFNKIGGYNSRKAFFMCLVFGCMAVAAAIPVPFANTSAIVYILLWLIFFFGAIIIAPLVGMMLNTVPQKGKASANALATLCYNLFGYFPAPFVFGGIADIYKDDTKYSMRLAMGTITYWSIFAALCLLGAILCKFGRTSQGQQEDNNNRLEGEKNIQQRPLLVSPREALSSNYGDSQVTLPAGQGQGNALVTAESQQRRNTALSGASSEESFGHTQEPTYYAGALNATKGIYENGMGPSGRYIESMAAIDQRYTRTNPRQIDRKSANIGLDASNRNRVTLAQTNRESTMRRTINFSKPMQEKNHQTSRSSQKLQLLNFQASHQSIFHSPLPFGFGIGRVREQARKMQGEREQSSDSDSTESEAKDT